MNIILLSGGSGKRLWPLSNEVRSKQFLKIFKNKEGFKESMVQRMYRMITEVDPNSTITIATSENQIPQIIDQLGDHVGISIEPTRKDTFPAIALAAAYLKKQGVSGNEAVVVCPVDPYVEKDYFDCLKELSDEASREGSANLTLMGIEPIYPSTKYGYIIPTNDKHIAPVHEFKEKPNEEKAQEYINKGALWNGGVFAFKLNYVLEIALRLFGTDSYECLKKRYESLQKISFDYAVVEHEKSISVIRFSGSWKDLGTWNTLSESMDEEATGNVIMDSCHNTHIINELKLPIIALGIIDAVIAATPDGILVTNKDKSTELKNYVADARPMYERLEWGEYKVLDYQCHENGQNNLTREIIIKPGYHTNYQSNNEMKLIWAFTEGIGEIIMDDIVKEIKCGEVAIINPGMKYAVKGITELHIIEIQIGNDNAGAQVE